MTTTHKLHEEKIQFLIDFLVSSYKLFESVPKVKSKEFFLKLKIVRVKHEKGFRIVTPYKDFLHSFGQVEKIII